MPINFVVGGRCIADDFPTKKSAHLSKRMRIGVAKHDDVFRIERHDKVLTFPPKHHQSFWVIEIRGQFNLTLKTPSNTYQFKSRPIDTKAPIGSGFSASIDRTAVDRPWGARRSASASRARLGCAGAALT